MNKLMLKKKYMMYSPKKSSSRLPSGFQEVEYIESNGNQWIDTNYIPSIDDVIETDIEITTLVSHKSWWTTVFGSYPTKSLWIYKSSNENDSYFSTYSGGSEQNKIMKVQTNVPYNIIFNKSTIIVNGTSYSIKNGTGTSQDALSLFRVNPYTQSQYQVFIGKIKEFKITNNITKLDLVPCYRKSDNEVGLYDIVGKQFYTNQGSGTFQYGREIFNIDGYRQVEYIAGNNAYIEYPYVTNGLTVGFDISFDVPRTSLTQDTPIIQNDWQSNWVPLGMSLTNKNKTYFGSYDMSNIPYWTNDTYTYNEDRYLINYKNSNVISSIGKSTWSHTLSKSLNDVAITYFTFMSVGVPSTFHLKSLDMTDGDNIVARFIPMEETSTGLVGLYDLVGKKFYSSQTNSNFIKGDYIQ